MMGRGTGRTHHHALHPSEADGLRCGGPTRPLLGTGEAVAALELGHRHTEVARVGLWGRGDRGSLQSQPSTSTARHPGRAPVESTAGRRRDRPYLEDGAEVGQRGPPPPGLAHALAVGIVLVGGHHVHRVVAEGPGAEGAAREVRALAARGLAGRPAGLLHAQQGADGEAASAAGGGLRAGQLGHFRLPRSRSRCQGRARGIYTRPNQGEPPGTPPVPQGMRSAQTTPSWPGGKK